MTEVVGPFRKSSFSQGETDCISVARTTDGGRAVRDSKNPTGGTQFYSPAEWTAFVRAIKNGEFDA